MKIKPDRTAISLSKILLGIFTLAIFGSLFIYLRATKYGGDYVSIILSRVNLFLWIVAFLLSLLMIAYRYGSLGKGRDANSHVIEDRRRNLKIGVIFLLFSMLWLIFGLAFFGDAITVRAFVVYSVFVFLAGIGIVLVVYRWIFEFWSFVDNAFRGKLR